MATYLELGELHSNSELLTKVQSAVIVAATNINTEIGATPNHTNRLLWAKATLLSPKSVAKSFYPAILAANKSATPTQIVEATDEAIQINVDSLIDLFATGA